MKRQITITIAVGLVMFLAGFFMRGMWFDVQTKEGSPEENPASGADSAQMGVLPQENAQNASPQVRINDGNVEWYDGIRWNLAASVEQLEKEDPFNATQEARKELEQRLLQERAEKQQMALASLNREENVPLIGEKEEQKPAAPQQSVKDQKGQAQNTSKQPAVSSVQQTQTPAQSVPVPDSSSDNSSSDDNSSDDSSSDDGSSGGQDAPVDTPPADEPADTPAEDPGTGDGENMEWSNDYL